MQVHLSCQGGDISKAGLGAMRSGGGGGSQGRAPSPGKGKASPRGSPQRANVALDEEGALRMIQVGGQCCSFFSRETGLCACVRMCVCMVIVLGQCLPLPWQLRLPACSHPGGLTSACVEVAHASSLPPRMQDISKCGKLVVGG